MEPTGRSVLIYLLDVTKPDLARRPANSLAAYAAAAWAFLFAIPSFYWGAGGGLGEGTIAADVEDSLGVLGEPWFVAPIGAANVVVGLVPLALVLNPPLNVPPTAPGNSHRRNGRWHDRLRRRGYARAQSHAHGLH
jgi:hypothetical protein